MAYKGVEHLRAPDVFVGRSRRSAPVWDENKYTEEGMGQTTHQVEHAPSRTACIWK
jgi:hypothetical protein